MAGEEKKSKGGRPKKIIKRESVIGIRFTKKEHFIVKGKAAKTGLTLSVYVRKMAIYGKVNSRLSDEERQYVRQLAGMSNNMNQVAKCCHQEGVLKAMVYFEKMRDEIDRIISTKTKISSGMFCR